MPSPERIRWGAIAIFMGVAVFLFLLDQTGSVSNFVGFLRDPLSAISSAASQPAQSVSGVLEGPRDIQAAQAEIEALQARVAVLERENEELSELQGEYQLLQNLFDYAVQSPQNTRLLASVIGYDSNPQFESLIIDRGSNDGVVVGMPVDSPRGLVGQVFRTTPNASLVLLVTDASSSVPARLSASRATGLIHGRGDVGGELLMDWIDLESVVEIGDLVLTSGLVGGFPDGISVGRFPKGLVVGRVVDVQRTDAEILQRATVQSAVDFRSLEQVFVITDFPREDISVFEDPFGEDGP